MKASLLLLATFSLLCQYVAAQPAAHPAAHPGGLSVQQRAQRASSCRGKLNKQAKQVAKKFCLAYLNGQQPQHSTTTSVVALTTTTTPVVSLQSTSIATEQTTTTSVETFIVTNPVKLTATATVTATTSTTKTVTTTSTSTAPLPPQKRRRVTLTFGQQVANSFPREVIIDACLLYVYGTLAYPVATVTTASTATATAVDAITVVSTTATTTTVTETDFTTVAVATAVTLTASATTTQSTTATSTESVTATTTVSGKLYYSYTFYIQASLANSPLFDSTHTNGHLEEAIFSSSGSAVELYGYGYPSNQVDPQTNSDIRSGYLRTTGLSSPEAVLDPATGKVYISLAPQYVPQGYDRVYCTRPSSTPHVLLSCHGYALTTYTTFYSCPNTVAGQSPTIFLLPAASAPSGCTEFTFTTK